MWFFKKDEKYYVNKAENCVESGKYEKAIEYCEKLLKINPDNDAAYYIRGLSYRNLNQYEKAIEDYTKAIELNPDNEEIVELKNECIKLMNEK